MLSALGRSVAAVAFSLGLVAVAAACGDDEPPATANSVTIKPSSYVVRDAVTTSTVPVAAGPDAEGRWPAEQTYTVVDDDFPILIADLYDIDVDELREYNGWADDYSDFPDAGSTVRIPPNALYIDPNASTTTTTEEPETSEEPVTEDSTETTPEGAPQGCTPGQWVVEDGDNPTIIAQRFDVTLEALTAANGWDAEYSNFQRTGETVVIPPGSTCTTVPPG